MILFSPSCFAKVIYFDNELENNISHNDFNFAQLQQQQQIYFKYISQF